MVDVASSTRAGVTKFVCFCLHDQEYAAHIKDVKETILLRPITRVFLTPNWLSGIINLRGDIVAVIDLAQLLGLPPTIITDDSRIVIARNRDKTVGIIADHMAELRTLDPAELQPPPATLSADGAALFAGVATVADGAAVQVLDLAAIFASERMRAFQREK